ncbi:LytTR family DNA-binding domain-containing protein [Leeuwenhoekiella marinoflava]|uniref:LytR/AlgR family response regulator transcription factor n=1 Tax=Leeuwenhoekiella marinoflava TaxID=988 RepID=UPI0030022025
MNKLNENEVTNFKNSIRPKYIAVNSHSGIKIIEVNDILYLESSGRYTIIYVNNNMSVTVCKNLGHYEKLFSEIDFLRVHHSFIINIAFLEKIMKDGGGQYCLLNKNKIIPISKRRFSMVKKYLYY